MNINPDVHNEWWELKDPLMRPAIPFQYLLLSVVSP